MKIKISKWDNHNPRSDYKSLPWFRCSSRMYREPKLRGIPTDAKWFWICLLCIACEENKSGVIDLDLEWLAEETKFSPKIVLEYLKILEKKYLIELTNMTPTNVTRTSDERGPNKTLPLRTNERTDERQVKDIAAPPPGSAVWEAYSGAYFARYAVAPVRNAKSNRQCAELVKRLGIDAAIGVVKFYLTHSNGYYVQRHHGLDPCVYDAEGLHTQMINGVKVTRGSAAQADGAAGNVQVFQNVAKLWAEREKEEGSK